LSPRHLASHIQRPKHCDCFPKMRLRLTRLSPRREKSRIADMVPRELGTRLDLLVDLDRFTDCCLDMQPVFRVLTEARLGERTVGQTLCDFLARLVGDFDRL